MSPTETKKFSDQKQAAIPLMVEYTEKLYAIREKMRTFYEESLRSKSGLRRVPTVTKLEMTHLSQLYQTLLPPAKELASYVSQQIEHGRLDLLTRIEFRLRLAELENSILSTQDLFERVSKTLNGK